MRDVGVLVVLALVTGVVASVGWFIHRSMTIENSAVWGYGSYRAFVREFSKREWDNRGWGGSFFSDDGSQSHAGIYRFKDLGMVLPFFTYWRVLVFLHGKATPSTKRTVDWETTA